MHIQKQAVPILIYIIPFHVNGNNHKTTHLYLSQDIVLPINWPNSTIDFETIAKF